MRNHHKQCRWGRREETEREEEKKKKKKENAARIGTQ